MKSLRLLIIALLVALVCQSTPLFAAALTDTNAAPVNYVIQVKMKDSKGNASSLRVMAMAGSFNLNSLQESTVKINNSEIPSTLKLSGTLTPMSAEKGVLKIFLGRTVPYVTGTNFSGSGPTSSYAQMSVGIDSTLAVTFGKPLVVQVDDSGEVTVLVTREEN